MKVNRFSFEKLSNTKVVTVLNQYNLSICFVCLVILLYDHTNLFLGVSQFLVSFLFFKSHLGHSATVWPYAIDFTYL